MPRVRIWALESDHDAEAIRCLAYKLVTYLNLDGLSIQSSGRSAVPKSGSRRDSSSDSLKIAVQNYLEEDACVIFVIDSDSPMSKHQRNLEYDSLLSRVHRVLEDQSLTGRVFFSEAVHELESWLLVDCLGIVCYFASKREQYKTDCRDKVSKNKNLMRIASKNQKGDTQLIVEAEIGGKGPKEYLMKFSEEILLGLNPRMPQRNVRKNRYKENQVPEAAEHVVIDGQTLSRNKSLQVLGSVLKRFK